MHYVCDAKDKGIKQKGVSKCLPITMKKRKLFAILEDG